MPPSLDPETARVAQALNELVHKGRMIELEVSNDSHLMTYGAAILAQALEGNVACRNTNNNNNNGEWFDAKRAREFVTLSEQADDGAKADSRPAKAACHKEDNKTMGLLQVVHFLKQFIPSGYDVMITIGGLCLVILPFKLHNGVFI